MRRCKRIKQYSVAKISRAFPSPPASNPPPSPPYGDCILFLSVITAHKYVVRSAAMTHSYFIEHDIKILDTTCERQDKRKGGVAFFLNGLPNPSPMGSRPPPPWPSLSPNVCTQGQLSRYVDTQNFPQCFVLSDCSATPSPIKMFPAKNQISPTPSWTNH